MANARSIVPALEAGGDHVGVFYHAKVMGRMVYETGDGWNFKRGAA